MPFDETGITSAPPCGAFGDWPSPATYQHPWPRSGNRSGRLVNRLILGFEHSNGASHGELQHAGCTPVLTGSPSPRTARHAKPARLPDAREAGDVYKQVRDRAAQCMLEIAVIERLAERIDMDAGDDRGASDAKPAEPEGSPYSRLRLSAASGGVRRPGRGNG